jgi:hypothetical protein
VGTPLAVDGVVSAEFGCRVPTIRELRDHYRKDSWGDAT